METENKKYIVVWFYCANYGYNEVIAKNPEQAIKEHIFFNRKDIELMAFENNNKTSAYKPIDSEFIKHIFRNKAQMKKWFIFIFLFKYKTLGEVQNENIQH